MKFLTFPSPFGTFTILWKGTESDLQLQRIFLSDPKQNSETKVFESFKHIKSGSSKLISTLGDKIQQFLKGGNIEFNLELLDFNVCTNIQEKVLKADFRIPRGWVSTYKRIANYIRVQNGARVVGNSLARNPFPIIIPCHRAIKSNGELGGYQGGITMKRALLELEGVKLSDKGKVITENMYY